VRTNNAFGDFQTPLNWAYDTVKYVLAGREYDTVIEPTCGTGAFLKEAFDAWPGADIWGVEIKDTYAQKAKSLVPKANVVCADAFRFDWNRIVQDKPNENKTPAIGNPPWVTNAEQGMRSSENLPVKSNFCGFKNPDALTGSSNFDLSEFLIFDIASRLRNKKVDFCLLCKAKAARNLTETMKKQGLDPRDVRYYRIDAKKHFHATSRRYVFSFL
jgi:hypothetical protein